MSTLSQACDDAREWILARLEAEESASVERASLEIHLQACPPCREYADEMAVILGSLRELPWEAPPVGMTDRIMASVEAEVPSKTATSAGKTSNVLPLPKRWLFSRPGAVAAAVALIALAVPFALNVEQSTRTQQVATVPASQQSAQSLQASSAARPLVGETLPPSSTASPDMTVSPAVGTGSGITVSEPALPVATHSTASPILPPSRSASKAATPVVVEPAAPAATENAADQLIATALPENAFAGETEDDPYYDPLSEWVGF